MLGTAALKGSSLLLCKKYSSKIPLEKKKKSHLQMRRKKKDSVQCEFQNDSHPVPPSSTYIFMVG